MSPKPPLCKGRCRASARRRDCKKEKNQRNTIPQSASLTAPFAQGSLLLNPTFQLQKHYKSVVGITPYSCLLQWEKVPSLPRRMRCFRHNVTQASLSREGDHVSGGRSFFGIELLNFILHAYSSTRLRREPPRGGSLLLNPTFQLQKHYKSVVEIMPYSCLLQWEKVSPIGDG